MSTVVDAKKKRTARARFAARTGTVPEGSAHEDIERGILPTEISPKLAWAMTVSFLILIFALPIAQVAVELMGKRDIQALEVFTRIPMGENLERYEKGLGRQ